MDATPLTCELVDRDDIDQRYLAGTLPSAHAEEFEEHYFGCERCWALVERGLALRAAGAAGTEGSATSAASLVRAPIAPPRRLPWIGLAAAAVLLLSAVVWHPWSRNAPVYTDTMRGTEDSFVVVVSVRDDSILSSWPRVRAAADYRVRISMADGTPLLERAVADTATAIPLSTLLASRSDTVYVSVLARDALRHPVARSALSPVALGRP